MAFELIENKGDPEKGTGIFSKINQKAISYLERLTSVEKAMAVPYLKIWQVDPSTGLPAFPVKKGDTQPKRPITSQAMEPPPFSAIGDVKSRERPAVSLENVVLSTTAMIGRYQYFKVTIKLVVHRSDALNNVPTDKDSYSSLIIPGNVFAMEYGWRGNGVKNPLFNGDGLVEGDVIIPSTKIIYFTVYNYDFNPKKDLEIPLTIYGSETGLLNLRKINLGQQAKQLDKKKLPKEFQFSTPQREALQNFYGTKEGKELKKKFEQGLQNEIYNKASGGKIKFKAILDYFSKTIIEGFKETGYSGEIRLKYGRFNSKVGTTSVKYFSKDYSNSGKNEKGDPIPAGIGDFEFPKAEVQRIVTEGFKAGKALTVFNFLELFLANINKISTWSSKNSKKREDNSFNQSTPDIFVKLVPSGNSIGMYIIDAKSEFIGFSDDWMKKHYLGTTATQEQIRNAIKEKGIPYISFLNGNSYIEDSNFKVVTDEKIKAHLNQTFYGTVHEGKDKRQQTKKTDKENKAQAIDPGAFLYSSSIQGDIPMLGNFAFDMFSLCWIDFDVNLWSGPFNIRAREDTISQEGFTTKVSFISAGGDPLGTSGARKPPALGLAPSVVAGIES